MTLIVVVKAPNGVAIASDSAATFLEGVKYPTTKIRVAGNRFVWGGAGHEGLIQEIDVRLANALENTDAATVEQLSAIDLRNSIQGLVHPVMQQYAQRHVQGLAPPYHEPATAQLLIMTCCAGEPVIIEVEPSGAIGQLEAYGFAAIGSGAPYAHAIFMRFRKKVIPLDLAEVIAYRAVEEAIEVASYGLAGPVQLWRLQVEGGGRINICELKDEELERVLYALDMWRENEVQSLPTGIDLPDRPLDSETNGQSPAHEPPAAEDEPSE